MAAKVEELIAIANGKVADPSLFEPKPRRRAVPIIEVSHDLDLDSTRGWKAIERANDPPRLFRNGSEAVRIDGTDDDHPILQPLTSKLLRYELALSADFEGKDRKGAPKPTNPPMAVVDNMLAYPVKPLPQLVAISRVPLFAPDGSLHEDHGYSEASRAYYLPSPGFVVPQVPEHPSVADVNRACDLIVNETLGDFPFTSRSEKANAIAFALTPYVRLMIDGPTPLGSIEGPTPGVGKGLLAQAILIPIAGREFSAMPAPNDDDEWRKRLTAVLMQNPVGVLIDNVNRLESGALAAALTATHWTDRKLGSSDMVYMPINCIWLSTANNPVMSTEIARRTVRIRVDPKIDQPWRRTGPDGELEWRHKDLRQWIRVNRAELVWAALTLIRHWQSEGCPTGDQTLGSYESWASIMGGILGCAGIDGFLDNLETFYEAADLEGQMWRQFIAQWSEEFASQEVGVADLFTIASNTEGFELGLGSERSQKIAFGIALTRQRDRVIGSNRIVNTRTVKGIKKWRLIPTSELQQAQPMDFDGGEAHESDGDKWTQL